MDLPRRMPLYLRVPVAIAAYSFAVLLRFYDYSERRRDKKRGRRQ